MEVLGWVIFWLSVAQIPFYVALRRLVRGRPFRILNRWIVRAGLGQVLLPLVAMGLLSVGFPPYARRAEEQLNFVVMIWLVSFAGMWVLFLALGLACAFWPKRTEGAPRDTGAKPKRAWARYLLHPRAGACTLVGLAAIVYVRTVALPPEYRAVFYLIAAGALGLGLRLVVRAYHRRRDSLTGAKSQPTALDPRDNAPHT